MSSTAVRSLAINDVYTDPAGSFTILDRTRRGIHRLLEADAYSAALAFIKGEMAVQGDIFSAVRFFSEPKTIQFS
jgi:hypothetical protein